ncbi:hypothetical protein MMAD_54380 [Mycolicibacterium madagascariense]|uniref:Uncharacterized protein n=1 Tax=Mycolicibacterium madagascariense TaxID=212765 RepID=A0A7I7XPV8_9MYCO|nr:hypothetical protein MMAD_54380 [Mycolicibacterium madagascariense]
MTRRITHGPLLRSPADYRHRNTEQLDDLAEKLRPPQERLDQGDRDVGPRQPQGNARQSRATADVCDALPRVQQFGHRGAIQNVPFPESIDFPWTNESTLDAGAGQHGRILLCQLEAFPEHCRSGRRRRRRFTMFHVKHPPTPTPPATRTTSL